MHSENIGELSMALAKAQGEMKPAVKDSTNPFFKSKYADLNSVINAIREPLSRNELAFMQNLHDVDGVLNLVTILSHKSGQFIKSQMAIRVKLDTKTNELQALGSAISYLKRYALSALIGVSCDEDDDGNSSAGFTTASSKPAPVTHKPVNISNDQATSLTEILKKCPEGYVTYVNNYLKSQNIESINSLPLSLFERLWNDANMQARNNNGKSAE